MGKYVVETPFLKVSPDYTISIKDNYQKVDRPRVTATFWPIKIWLKLISFLSLIKNNATWLGEPPTHV